MFGRLVGAEATVDYVLVLPGGHEVYYDNYYDANDACYLHPCDVQLWRIDYTGRVSCVTVRPPRGVKLPPVL